MTKSKGLMCPVPHNSQSSPMQASSIVVSSNFVLPQAEVIAV